MIAVSQAPFDLLVDPGLVAVRVVIEAGQAEVGDHPIEGDARRLLLLGRVVASLVRLLGSRIENERNGRGDREDRRGNHHFNKAESASSGAVRGLFHLPHPLPGRWYAPGRS